jgi:hypothetical protein
MAIPLPVKEDRFLKDAINEPSFVKKDKELEKCSNGNTINMRIIILLPRI